MEAMDYSECVQANFFILKRDREHCNALSIMNFYVAAGNKVNGDCESTLHSKFLEPGFCRSFEKKSKILCLRVLLFQSLLHFSWLHGPTASQSGAGLITVYTIQNSTVFIKLTSLLNYYFRIEHYFHAICDSLIFCTYWAESPALKWMKRTIATATSNVRILHAILQETL